MPRIQPVDPESTSEKVREALDALPPLNIFRTLAHAETAFRPFLRFGGAVLGRMQLDPIVRELAILTVAHEAEAEYEWVQHVAIAKAVGATDAQIDAIAHPAADAPDPADGDVADPAAAAAGDPADRASALDPAQAAAIELARAVVHASRISDDLFERVRAQFSDREIVELLLAIGDYLMLARVMTVLEIEIDEAVGDAVLRGRRDRSSDGT